MRRWIVIALIALLATLVTAAWVRQDAPRPLIAQTIGVLPRTPYGGSFCGWFVRNTWVGAVPTGGIQCSWYRRPTAGRRAEHDQIFYHAVSRDVAYAERSWEPASRTRWQQDVDSVRSALRNRGGVPTCEQLTKRSDTRLQEFWRFPGFEVMLSGGAVPVPAGSSRVDNRWALFLHAEPGSRRLC